MKTQKKSVKSKVAICKSIASDRDGAKKKSRKIKVAIASIAASTALLLGGGFALSTAIKAKQDYNNSQVQVVQNIDDENKQVIIENFCSEYKTEFDKIALVRGINNNIDWNNYVSKTILESKSVVENYIYDVDNNDANILFGQVLKIAIENYNATNVELRGLFDWLNPGIPTIVVSVPINALISIIPILGEINASMKSIDMARSVIISALSGIAYALSYCGFNDMADHVKNAASWVANNTFPLSVGGAIAHILDSTDKNGANGWIKY